MAGAFLLKFYTNVKNYVGGSYSAFLKYHCIFQADGLVFERHTPIHCVLIFTLVRLLFVFSGGHFKKRKTCALGHLQ